MERRDFQKIFVIKDIHGKTWTTKRGLEILLGVCAADSKKYFYDVEIYERFVKNERFGNFAKRTGDYNEFESR